MKRLLWVCLLLQGIAFAQQAPAERAILVEVFDLEHHKQVDDFDPGNFQVSIEGDPVSVTKARRENRHPNVVIILDVSNRVGPHRTWDFVFEATNQCFRALAGSAHVSALAFNDKFAKWMAAPDESVELFMARLTDLHAKGDPRVGHSLTHLAVAIRRAWSDRNLEAGDAIIVISDSGEPFSIPSDRKLKTELASKGVRIFPMIAVNGMGQTTPEEGTSLGELMDLAESGGGYPSFLQDYDVNVMLKHVQGVTNSILRPCVIRFDVDGKKSGKVSIRYRDLPGRRSIVAHVFAPKILLEETASPK